MSDEEELKLLLEQKERLLAALNADGSCVSGISSGNEDDQSDEEEESDDDEGATQFKGKEMKGINHL